MMATSETTTMAGARGEVLTSTHGQTNLPRYFGAVFAIAKRLKRGRLDFVLPDGRRFRIEGAEAGPVAELDLHDNEVFARLIREGDLGFSEAYVDGEWSSPDLMAFMDLVHQGNNDVYDSFPGMGIMRAFERLRFWWQSNTKRGAKKNIAAHYDLGNDFYALWLDESMTYSSAIFVDGQESMEAAQERKYASMVDRMGVAPGDHVLEIGCGWGGFAEYAAKERGLRVTALTISQAQHDFAVARMQRLGLQDKVEIRLQDYRDVRGSFDGIASVEMFEAVGEAFWPSYFRTLRDRLKPQSRAVIQVITVQNDRFETYRKSVDFIQKYIFPGGMLPSAAVLEAEAAKVGLSVTDLVEFGKSYSQTLRRWHEVFNSRWDEVAAMGFDARFKRMWNFYLTSCAGTFEGGNCDVIQVTFSRP
ncbi:MAG: class I SAM-dependent methyltransferase [Cypionkella sp.]